MNNYTAKLKFEITDFKYININALIGSGYKKSLWEEPLIEVDCLLLNVSETQR